MGRGETERGGGRERGGEEKGERGMGIYVGYEHTGENIDAWKWGAEGRRRGEGEKGDGENENNGEKRRENEVRGRQGENRN